MGAQDRWVRVTEEVEKGNPRQVGQGHRGGRERGPQKGGSGSPRRQKWGAPDRWVRVTEEAEKGGPIHVGQGHQGGRDGGPRQLGQGH